MQRLPTPLPPYHLFRNKWNGAGFISCVLVSPVKIWLRWTNRSWAKTVKQYETARFDCKYRNDKSAPLSKQRAFHGGIRIHNGSQGLLAALSRTLAASSIGSMKPNPFFSLNLMQWNTIGHHGDFHNVLLPTVSNPLTFFLCENP